MADKSTKWLENAEGKYYVDAECIECHHCCETAPKFFIMSDEGHAYVTKQPVTNENIGLCESAMDGCPVEAIGDDG